MPLVQSKTTAGSLEERLTLAYTQLQAEGKVIQYRISTVEQLVSVSSAS